MPHAISHATSVMALALTTLCAAQLAPTAPPSLYLSPGALDPVPGAAITLSIESLDAAKVVQSPWPESIRWLFVRSPGFQENRSQDDAPRPAPSERSISITLEHPGITVVGLDLPARIVEWPVAQLRTVQGAAAPAQGLPEAGSVRVRLIESAKTILRVGPDSSDSVATSKTGQAVEIRPYMDPALAPVGSDIVLRAYINGDAVNGALVTATHTATGQTQLVQFNPTGSGFFHVSAAGVWRLEFRQARPLDNDPVATWAVYSATLTFSSPGAPPVPVQNEGVKP